jgi:hypothetical protein
LCAGDQLLLSSAVPSLHLVVGNTDGVDEPSLRILGSESTPRNAMLALVADIFHEIQVALQPPIVVEPDRAVGCTAMCRAVAAALPCRARRGSGVNCWLNGSCALGCSVLNG